MSQKRYSIQVQKDYLKFSAAHFLIFEDGTSERLHGHNYKVFVKVETSLDSVGLVIDFQLIKPLISSILARLDERFLLPGEHPELEIHENGGERVEIRYRKKLYVIPREDVLILPFNNSSAENLAAWIAARLEEELLALVDTQRLRTLSVGVEETTGQRGTCTIEY